LTHGVYSPNIDGFYRFIFHNVVQRGS